MMVPLLVFWTHGPGAGAGGHPLDLNRAWQGGSWRDILLVTIKRVKACNGQITGEIRVMTDICASESMCEKPGQESGGRDRVLTGLNFTLEGDGGGWVR